MTQQDETSRNDYVGNSSTTEFVYTFKILDRTHIQVVLIEDATQFETIQTIDTDYDVTGVLEDGGGTVTFFTAPASGFSIILGREVPFNQESAFVEGNPFPADTVETNYDKLTQIAQELRMTQRTALKPPLLPNFKDGTLKPGFNTEINAGDILQINDDVDGFITNSVTALFDSGALTAHQLVQLGNISETTFIGSPEWDFLGNMNQGVSTSDDVTFASVNGATNLGDIAGLTADEIDQLKNIDSNLISNDSWSNVASLDQDVDTSSSPEFAGLTVGGEEIGSSSIHANQNFSSGSIVDGNLSIATTTTFSLTSGSGIIVDYSTDELNPSVAEVSWAGFIGVTLLNIGVGSFKSIAIDVNGDIVQTNDGFTNLELRDLIPIGIIAHDATDILLVIDFPRKAIGRFDVLTDLITTIGTLNVSGNIFSPNGANLQVNKTVGETFGLSLNATSSQKFANITTDVGGVAVEMTPIFRDGSGGFTFGTASTDIDPGNFDDGTGTLNSLGNNQATNHRLAFSPNGGRVFFLYGQTEYANLTAAVDAVVDEFVVASISNAEINVRTIISARGGASDLNDVADAIFTQLSRFDASGGQTNAIQAATLQSAYDQDESIVLAAATPISVQVDSDLDKVVSYKDSAGTQKYTVDGLGNIDTFGTDTVTGNPGQGATPLRLSQDDSLNAIQTVFEDKTQFDKHVEINNSDDDEIPLDITGSGSPNTFLLRVRDNALNNLMTLDNDGQLLLNGLEVDSGAGEFVVAYQQFGILDPVNTVKFLVAPFDDALISGYRIEINDLRASQLGNDPGTVPFHLNLRFRTSVDVEFKSGLGNYVYLPFRVLSTMIVSGINIDEGDSFYASPLIGIIVDTVLEPGPTLAEAVSCVINIPSIPEKLEDRMMISATGSGFVDRPDNPIQIFTNSGYFHNFDASEEDEVIEEIQINCSIVLSGDPIASGIGFTAGSIKVIAIKKGGPAFT